ncbi:Prion-like-(Q/N-rich)-domain-bearing protein [Caenorhabditis elegans]|nr:Prion-like-(Q/N-rich)-domain-bearing protein [Caenorhabditis elegans]CCD73375.1 Prion-like-(Q/N-rich)-domain-bearing protein [Caenorhabditis elegans]|eukprot:NP_001122527.1 Prion-like-(Q/N-rich)-domain-bearing protein [Caenorhabditis elegans]
MNGGRKRRFPITIVVSSILILIVSVVTAQQVFDGNRQVAFVRRQPPFQQNQLAFQQQNRNFIRQQFRLQPRQNFMVQQQRFRQPPRVQNFANQNFQQFRPRVVQPTRPVPPQVTRRAPAPRPAPRPALSPTPRPPFSIRAPLSPIPFGAVQRSRRPISQPSSPTPITTTTQLPATSSPTTTSSLPVSTSQIHSVGGSLRRPIRVQQLQLNLRRKPQMTRGQFRRPVSKHQPTHRVPSKIHRITQPIVSTTSEPITTTEDVTLTVAGTTTEGLQADNLKKVDDIEAAILQAVIESSSPEPPRSSTHRQRIHRIRPGHRIRPSPPAPPPRVDAIEEAVLRAVLEVSTSIAPETSSLEAEAETTTVSETTTTEVSTTASESTSLFPAFASRRHGHRRPPTTTVPSTTLELITEPTSTETIPITTTTAETTTTTSEEPTVTEETTTELVTDVTIALPDEEFEDINAKIETENHQLHQIEENVISALSTPTSTISASPSPPSPLPTTSGPSPPSPPAPPHEFSLHGAGPPGLMPPSDDIVDELNGSSDFLQAAQRLHLLRRLLQ